MFACGAKGTLWIRFGVSPERSANQTRADQAVRNLRNRLLPSDDSRRRRSANTARPLISTLDNQILTPTGIHSWIGAMSNTLGSAQIRLKKIQFEIWLVYNLVPPFWDGELSSSTEKTSCARGDTICPAPLLPCGRPSARAPPSRRNVAVVSHAQYVLTVTAAPASRVKAAVSKVAWWPWPLTSWPWKWCLSHVWRGLPLRQFWSS